MQPTTQDLAEQLDRIEDMLSGHIQDSMVWRQKTEAELSKNTEVTEQVQAIATTGRTIRSAVIWLGGLAGGAVGLYQLWQVLQ